MIGAPDQAETAAVVALLRVGQQPPHVYAELLEQRQRSAAAILDQELTEPHAGPQAQISLPVTNRSATELLEQATEDVDRWQQASLRLMTVLDPDYPDNLRAVHDRPPLIFLAGRLVNTDDRAVAVIGSRKATDTGKATATEIAVELATAGYTIVSGLAEGIDTAAHEAALRTPGGRTIAVIGTGLNHAYPPQNAQLQSQIQEQGAVVSQFWPEEPPSRASFPLRNATMSGLALGTVIVEAGAASGARIQARRALAHGRRLFLCRQVLSHNWARQLSERPAVQVIDDADQIRHTLDRLGRG